MSTESVMPSNHLILCHPLLLLPSIFPRIRIFPNKLALHIRWPKYWCLSFSIGTSNEYSGLISFRIELFDLPAIKGTLKSLLQYHNSKASILWLCAFIMVHLSHPYITAAKAIALTIQTFVSNNVQFSSVAQSCPTLCDPMNRSMPGFPLHQQHSEPTQTHVYWVSDAIQPSHPLLFSFPPAFNPSQHQGLFKWVSSSHQVAKVLEFQLQHQSFQWIFRTDFL